jgi:sensor histidine kinase YesM
MVLKIDDNIQRPVLEDLKNIIYVVISNLPCPMCSNHAVAYFGAHQYTRISTLEQLRFFIYSFHEDVNKRLKKTSALSYAEHVLYYQPFNLSMVIKNVIQIYENMNNTNVTMMMYSFHRRRMVSDLDQYFRKHAALYRA